LYFFKAYATGLIIAIDQPESINYVVGKITKSGNQDVGNIVVHVEMLPQNVAIISAGRGIMLVNK
jgi:hypothetical protein